MSPTSTVPATVVIAGVGAGTDDDLARLSDAGRCSDMFDESIRRYLPGLSILLVPLIPAPGELIGMVLLYRKGEQPFGDHDVAIAEMIATPTAVAVRRND